jgi:hypothetical protein
MQQKTPGKNSSPPTPPIGENNQVGQKNPRPNSPLFVPLDTDEARDEVTDYDPTVGRPLSNKERSSKKKSTGAKKRKRGQNTVDLGSLAMSADTFTSIQALPDGETVDTRHRLDAKTKKEALNHLIASIPEVHRAAARGDKTYLNEQLKKFTGQGSCRAGEGSEGWILRGLRSRLKHYQMTGVAWMRENEGTDALGGILADSMGLGKTVMTIANIVNGLEDPLAETLPTLICVPSSLLAQWEAELNKHIDQDWLRKKNLQMVVPFHHKMESEPFVRLLEGAFIVLTTHHEVRRSCSKVKFPTDISTAEEREAWFKENRNKLRGILYKIRWRRFVIDEVKFCFGVRYMLMLTTAGPLHQVPPVTNESGNAGNQCSLSMGDKRHTHNQRTQRTLPLLSTAESADDWNPSKLLPKLRRQNKRRPKTSPGTSQQIHDTANSFG